MPPDTKVQDTKVTNTIIIKNKEDGISNDKIEPFDDDLQMPSELFDCSFAQDKDEIKEIPGEFYFESDHEALRGNPDYSKLLKAYAVLQAKKIQAVKDVESLLGAKEIALKFPQKFLQKFNDQ